MHREGNGRPPDESRWHVLEVNPGQAVQIDEEVRLTIHAMPDGFVRIEINVPRNTRVKSVGIADKSGEPLGKKM
jgi:Global regulator protein family